ncbi:MAG: GDSL-type esterase/lipase family protein [Propionibacteriaceae bacterium]|nr:GDSL-type esterase/lipase family protein [Propionibacteriaceae bacterium]
MKRSSLWSVVLLIVGVGLLCGACVPSVGNTVIPSGHGDSQSARTGQTVVACVGDSITVGDGVRQTESYPSQLQAKLGDGYVVLNFGHAGATANSRGDVPYMAQPEYYQALTSDPDIVILMIGTNDVRSPNDTPDLEATFESEYETLVNSFVGLPSKPIVYLVTPIRAILDNGAQESLLASLIRPQIRDVAARLGLPLIEFESILGDTAADYQADGIHPTATGYDVMSTELVRVVTGGASPQGKPPH